MPSATLHALCARWEAGIAAPAGCVIVDEASMADTRTLARLVALTERRARLVLVGDDRQLPGGRVRAGCSRSSSRAWVPSAGDQPPAGGAAGNATRSALLRDGRSDAALALWRSHDRIHTAADPVAGVRSGVVA